MERSPLRDLPDAGQPLMSNGNAMERYWKDYIYHTRLHLLMIIVVVGKDCYCKPQCKLRKSCYLDINYIF